MPELNDPISSPARSAFELRFRWPLAIVLVCLIWSVASQWHSLSVGLTALFKGQWTWLVPAGILIGIYYFLYATLYWSSFRCFGMISRASDLIGVLLGSIAVSVAAPGGTAIGALLFIDDARRKGQSPAKAAAGTLFVVFAELLGVALISLAGLNLLLSSNSLKHEAIVGVIVLIAFLIFLFFVLTFGVWAPKLLKLFIFKIAEWVNKAAIALRFKFRISREQAEGNADELISASQALKAHPIYAMQTIGISLFMFVILIGALALLFPAFGQDITTSEGLHRLCAGFVVGMLFWIVSPTPQGIGVVEIAMAVTFYKLGMPYPTALLIALSFRIISFWIPMICGVFFLKNLGSNATEPPTKRSLAVTGIAFTICLMGIIDVVSAVHPGVLARARFLHEHLPLEITRGSRLASALAGFALLLLSRGLWRRKRTAWILASVALFISIITHLIKGLDYEEASLATILLIWLASQRSKFYASSDPPSVAQALRVALASIVFTMAYGVLGLWILDNYFKVNYGLWAAIKQVFTMFVTFDGGGLIPVSPHGFGAYFRSSIYGVGAGTLIYTLLMILRPIIYRMPASDSERKKATGISQNFGKSPLARYALFNDKSYYFSEGGSMIAYAVVGRTVVALGDPIGPRDDAETSILGFTKYCRGNDWRVGFYQTLPDYIPSYKDMGYKCICIGHDAIVNLDDFSLAGGSNKQIRWSVNRFAKLGYKAEILNPPYSAELISKLRSVSDEWLLSMNGAEKRFSLGWFDEEYLQSCRILVVLDPDLQVTAFANILPTYGDNETTIDLMRRRDNAENYTMEFLFVKLLEWAKEQGYRRFNLGLSPLSGVGDEPGDPAVERALNYVYENLNQFYSFKGLHTFKSKFNPVWEPRYLIYPSNSSLPQIAFSAISANSGGAYLKAIVAGIKNYSVSRSKTREKCAEKSDVKSEKD